MKCHTFVLFALLRKYKCILNKTLIGCKIIISFSQKEAKVLAILKNKKLKEKKRKKRIKMRKKENFNKCKNKNIEFRAI